MTPFASTFSFVISLGAIGAQALIVAIIISRIFKADWSFIRFVKKQGVLLAFLTALGGMLFSLVYSDIIGFAPCELCLIQRFFLYPQVLILGFMLWRESLALRRMALVVSSIGLLVGLYHYYGQMFNADALAACETTGVSCAKIPFVEFGYITIPLLSITAFALIIALLLPERK
jgi:disulfide bond formation protein DsbB